MHWLTILFIGIAANLDNLGISVSYGLTSRRIPFLSNLLIAFVSTIFAYISMVAGSFLSSYFPSSIASLVGGILIICLGLWCIATSSPFTQDYAKKSENPHISHLKTENEIKAIGIKESFFLGFILALNCLTIGFSAGMTGIPSLLTSISIGFFSLLSISIGVKLGNKVGNTLFGKHSNRIAGLLLILIGLVEIFF